MGSPSGWCREVNCSRRSRRKALYPFMPSVAKMPSILLTIDRRSPVKSSRSRYARRASSSASLGIGTIPAAVFLFVSPAEVHGVAERFNGAPFDIEGVFWSHRGELCTFDTMLDELGLR